MCGGSRAGDWDQRTRAWVERTAARDLPLAEDEQLLSKMPGGYFSDDGFHRDWRPGSVYLTTHRVLVFRRDPRQVLWEAPLESIRTVGLRSETTIGGERLDRLHLTVDGEQEAVLSASAPPRLREMILQHAPQARRALPVPAEEADESSSAQVEGHMWYREVLAGRPEWRGGTARLDERGFTWKSPMDARPAIRLGAGELQGLDTGSVPAPFDDVTVMRLETAAGEVFLAGDASRWEAALQALVAEGREDRLDRGDREDDDTDDGTRDDTDGDTTHEHAKEVGDGPADR